MKIFAIIGILFFTAILESTIVPLPLSFIFLLLLSVWKRDDSIFLIACLSGIVLDILMVRTIGVSSLFFLFAVFLILSYQRKYEIHSFQFVSVASFIGSAMYLILFPRSGIVMYAILSCIVANLGYRIATLLVPRRT